MVKIVIAKEYWFEGTRVKVLGLLKACYGRPELVRLEDPSRSQVMVRASKFRAKAEA